MSTLLLAANGYDDLYTLLDGGGAPVDYIKCPGSPDSRGEVARARTYRPVVLHCWGPPGYSATQPDVPEPELLTELALSSGTPHLSVHLDYRPEKDGALDQESALRRVCEQVARLKALTGLEILLENVPWYPWTDRPRWGTDPAFIVAAIEMADAALLVDIAHARVSAWHRGEDDFDYLAALPLEKALEVHISGPRMSEEGLRDRHMSLLDEDYAALDFVLERAPNVRILTCEYAGRRKNTIPYGEPDGPERLAGDLERLAAVARAARP